MNILFVSWDGPQVSYIEGHYLHIFSALKARGINVSILHFSSASRRSISLVSAACKSKGIEYSQIPVFRRLGFFGLLLAVITGVIHILLLGKRRPVRYLMPRSVMPAFVCNIVYAFTNASIIYDSDGFGADERVDFLRSSPSDFFYRLLRDAELNILGISRLCLVRTRKSIRILRNRLGPHSDNLPFAVIPNGRQGSHYQDVDLITSFPEFTVCYVGSLGPQYLPDRMIAFAAALKLKLPSLKFIIFSSDALALEQLWCDHGLARSNWISMRSIPPEEVPIQISRCSLALSFRKKCFSTQGVFPIKVGDYLLSGLPIIGSRGVEVLDGMAEMPFIKLISDDEPFQSSVDWVCNHVIPNYKTLRCQAQAAGRNIFSMDNVVDAYCRALSTVEQ